MDNRPREHDYRKPMWGHALHGPKMVEVKEPGRWPWSKPSVRQELRCLGHGSVRKGDTILLAMQSGKVGRFVVREIEYFDNPPDMFDIKRADFLEYATDRRE